MIPIKIRETFKKININEKFIIITIIIPTHKSSDIFISLQFFETQYNRLYSCSNKREKEATRF